MITRVFNLVRGCICTFLIFLNTAIHGVLTIIFGGLAWLCFNKKCQPAAVQKLVLIIPTSWAFFNLCIIKISLFGKLKITGNAKLSRKQWYILVSNHQSWVDILILSGIFSLKMPPPKFFMKKELLWQLPIPGICCYLIGYPLMERHTRADIRKNPALKGKDIETTKQACQKFKVVPTTVINFAEGTRFTQVKRDKQESPFTHLLKPKAGGTAIVMNEMHDCLAGVLNVTINYDGDNISFFNLISGNIRAAYIDYELLPIEKELLGNYFEDRPYRSVIQRWFNDIWKRKDQLIDKMKSNGNK
jgi:1-acyl-sn-glycerol-3-phosphate acyltransferase